MVYFSLTLKRFNRSTAMHIIDWILFSLPVAFVIYSALRAQRYVHGVADFLSAGRIAHRYVLCVASAMPLFGVMAFIGDRPDSDHIYAAAVGILLILVAIGVLFIVRVSMVREGMQMLLEE